MVATNVTAFNIAVEKFGVDNREKFKLLRDKLAFQALNGVVFKTPVKTGRARGNWQVTLGNAATAQIERLDKTGGDAPASGNSGGPTIAAGVSVVNKAATFDDVFISNNLPYIEALENGRVEGAGDGKATGSIQAPNGMLAITFEEILTQFQ